LDNGAANRQAHAHAVLLGCEEGFEDRVRIFQSYPGVPYFHEDGIVRFLSGANEQSFGVIGHRIHGLDPVQEQVEYQLLQF